jgi:DNA phosphorothioation-associated putative methyltransferase
MQIDLRDLQVRYRDYHNSDNPPVLHCKNTYVLSDYPQYEKFAKLTKQEESWGLLENMKDISHWQGWQQKLKEHCAEIQGHRLVWLKQADSEAIKLLKAKCKGKKIK